MHLSRLLGLGPDLVRPGNLKLELHGVNSWCSSFRKRPDMLSGPVALFGFKTDKTFYSIRVNFYLIEVREW